MKLERPSLKKEVLYPIPLCHVTYSLRWKRSDQNNAGVDSEGEVTSWWGSESILLIGGSVSSGIYGRGASRFTLLLSIPLAVFIVAVRIIPSDPGWTWTTLPSGHCIDGMLSSLIRTSVPSLIGCWPPVHLVRMIVHLGASVSRNVAWSFGCVAMLIIYCLLFYWNRVQVG